MGACASKPKEQSDILETPATTENAVVESKNVETETVSQEEKADEVVAEKKEESAEPETQKEAEPAKPAEAETAKPAEAEPVKTEEAAVETVNETEPPKQEEAVAAATETKTIEEPLVTL